MGRASVVILLACSLFRQILPARSISRLILPARSLSRLIPPARSLSRLILPARSLFRRTCRPRTPSRRSSRASRTSRTPSSPTRWPFRERFCCFGGFPLFNRSVSAVFAVFRFVSDSGTERSPPIRFVSSSKHVKTPMPSQWLQRVPSPQTVKSSRWAGGVEPPPSPRTILKFIFSDFVWCPFFSTPTCLNF